MCYKFVYPCCGYDCQLSDEGPAEQFEEQWLVFLDEINDVSIGQPGELVEDEGIDPLRSSRDFLK